MQGGHCLIIDVLVVSRVREHNPYIPYTIRSVFPYDELPVS